jgi:hypothetical protein
VRDRSQRRGRPGGPCEGETAPCAPRRRRAPAVRTRSGIAGATRMSQAAPRFQWWGHRELRQRPADQRERGLVGSAADRLQLPRLGRRVHDARGARTVTSSSAIWPAVRNAGLPTGTGAART